MPLSPEERDQLLLETREHAKATAQTLEEVIVPAIYGNGGPGLKQRVEGLEAESLVQRGRVQAFRWLLFILAALGGAGGGVLSQALTG